MTRLTLLLLATAQRAAAADATCGGGDRARGRYPSIVIGCWQILERHDDEDAAVATLSAYMDAGFTTFDTADIYGQSERALGRLRANYTGDATPVIFTKYVTHRVETNHRMARAKGGGYLCGLGRIAAAARRRRGCGPGQRNRGAAISVDAAAHRRAHRRRGHDADRPWST